MLEAIWRYPLKSAQGERLSSVHVGSDGPLGDRAWACVARDGRIVSAKNPRRFGRLLEVRAVCGDEVGEMVTLHVPRAAPAVAGTPGADEVLSGWLGEPVRLSRVVPDGASLERMWPVEAGMIPDWAHASPGRTAFTAVAGARSGGRFVDFGAVHVVTVQQLRELEEEGVDADARRFRPNLVLDVEPAPDPGSLLQVGETLRLRVSVRTPRCAIPGAAQAGLPRAPDLLRALGRRRAEVGALGRAASFGVYADVLQPGTVSVGDKVIVAAESSS